MSQNQKPAERIVYVGDSRIKAQQSDNTPRDYAAYPGKTEAFVPNFLLKEWMVGAVVIVGFMALIVAAPAPLGYPADPLNGEFIPMPDWYFLFMYQLLKYPYMSDDFVVLATLVFPGLLFGGLMLAPFLDRGPERRFYRRPIASALMLLSVAAIVHLTYVSWSHYQSELVRLDITPEHIDRAERLASGRELPPKPNSAPISIPIVEADSEGYSIYERSTCISCHDTGLQGGGTIPGLLGIGDRYDKDQIMEIVVDGRGQMPASYEANLDKGLTEDEIDIMVEWLSLQKQPID